MNARALLIALALPATHAAAQAPVSYEVSFPNAVHHEAEVSVTFSQVPAGRPAGGAHEPLLAGALRAARVRQERVRGQGVRRAGAPAGRDPARPVRLERGRPRRHGARHLHAVRRPRRRHLRPGRRHPRAPQHARDVHVGARAGGAPGAGDLPPPADPRWKVATQLAPTADSVHLHRAGPAVLHGQPVGAERPRPAQLAGAERRPDVHHPPCAAPRRDAERRPTRSRRWRRRWWRSRTRSSASSRTSTTAPTPSWRTTCRGSPATGWSTATPPSSPARGRSPPPRAG